MTWTFVGPVARQSRHSRQDTKLGSFRNFHIDGLGRASGPIANPTARQFHHNRHDLNPAGSFGSFRVVDRIWWSRLLRDDFVEEDPSRPRSFLDALLCCRRIESEYLSSDTVSDFPRLFTEIRFFPEASVGMIGRSRF
jgi:hypothetical protein